MQKASRHRRTFFLWFLAASGFLGCDADASPEVSRLELMRQTAGTDTGTVRGTVYVHTQGGDLSACYDSTVCRPLSGALVQLGIWDGPAEAFRDSVRHFDARAALSDRRFEIVAETRTETGGDYVFSGLPRKQSFVLRALAPQQIGGGVGYFPSRFWLYSSPEMTVRVVIPGSAP